MKISFSDDEVLEMVRRRAKEIPLPGPGKLELRWGYYPSREVVAEFVPEEPVDKEPAAELDPLPVAVALDEGMACAD